MNKLHVLLEFEPSQTQEQFEKLFKKVFGIPAEIQDPDPDSVIFETHDEKFSIDFEGSLLWYLNKKWEIVDTIDKARELWKTKKN